MWLDRKTGQVFVPTETVVRVAKFLGVSPERIARGIDDAMQGEGVASLEQGKPVSKRRTISSREEIGKYLETVDSEVADAYRRRRT